MTKRILAAAGLLCLIAGCGSSTAKDLGGKASPQLSDRDNQYMTTVTEANTAEIQMSQTALGVSQSDAVKKFARKMIDDHTAAAAQVRELAAAVGFAPPTMLDSDHQRMVDGLKGKTGADFDKVYIMDQVDAHEAAIKATEDEANNGSNQQVKNLANELLPTLKQHLAMAKQLRDGGGM
jgi:putative membrane protein